MKEETLTGVLSEDEEEARLFRDEWIDAVKEDLEDDDEEGVLSRLLDTSAFLPGGGHPPGLYTTGK